AAVGFDRQRLGFWWFGQKHRFFWADEYDHPGLSWRQRLALVRWVRLPALWENQYQQPNLQAFAHAHPAELLAVALFGRGLDGLDLHFDRTPAGRLAFDAITRHLLLEVPLTTDGATAIDDLFAQQSPHDPLGLFVERLFPAHPVVAARVARLVWASDRSE